MKSIKKLNIAILALALLSISILGMPQTILAANGSSQSTTTLEQRQPYISNVRIGAGDRIQRQLNLGIMSTDIDYSQEHNTIQIVIKHQKDDKEIIELSSAVLQGITLYAFGNNENLIDFENTEEPENILNRGDGESTLLIKTKGLNPNTEYNLVIGSGLVSLTVTDPNDPGIVTRLETSGMQVQFKTRAFPQIDSIITGSVSENYDQREPILIKGNYFNDIVHVYFNNIPAYDVYQIKDDLLGNYYLKVYLPRGRNKLDVGTYDIIVSNGSYHETVLLSAFSVVKEGEYLPNEIERLKNQLKIGNTMEALGTSDTTLNLNSRYSDTVSLQIDSDEIFGQATLVRRIKYTAYKGDVINRLETKSMWGDMILSNIRPTSDDRRSHIEIITGRPDPYTTQLLRESLKGINIKSEFINVSGTGYSTSNIYLSIPYKDSDGTNLIALRYDEATRRWERELFYIDEVENRAYIFTNNQGTFVVVEYH